MTHPSTSSPIPVSDGKSATITIEIITEEEMALIEAAFAATAAIPAIQLHRNYRSITLLSKRGLSACTATRSPDIEDSGRIVGSNSPQKNKKNKVAEPRLYQFRRGRGLPVTDVTGTVIYLVFSFPCVCLYKSLIIILTVSLL